jgi:aminobenzoyl-glutamate transport protein
MRDPEQTPRGKGFLDLVERAGNRLPDPNFLFLIGAVLVIVISHLVMMAGITVQPRLPVQIVDPATGAVSLQLVDDPNRGPVAARSLLTSDGFYWAVRTMVDNFINFPPLGVVLVGMLGIGVAEKSGLLGALLRALMLVVPGSLFTPVIVFLGIMSSLATDAGYVVLPPLAAALYKSVGRSPLAGIAAAFAGVAAGFNANLLITSLDPLLANLSTLGAQMIDEDYVVSPTCNWAFMIVSTAVITVTGWVVTRLFVEPRLTRKAVDEGGPAPVSSEELEAQRLSSTEWRALRITAVVALLALGAGLTLILIPGAPFHGHGFAGLVPGKSNNLTDRFDRWIESIVPLIFFGFVIPGIAYGIVMRVITSTKDLARLMTETMADMAPIVVLAFFAGQFIAYFNHSNLGTMLAMWGGQALASSGLPGWSLIVAFILVTALFNLLVGSMSAKYTLFAPIFIPMLMLVGISPELTQAAYRIGDSVTNVITPLNAYLVIILVFMNRYAPRAGMGTLVSMMLPYSLTFLVVWTALLVVWINVGAPLGLPAATGPLEYLPPTSVTTP